MIKPLKKRNMAIRNLAFLLLSTSVFMLAVAASRGLSNAAASTSTDKTYAQQLVEETLAKHSELAGFELATTPPGKHDCVTIAATDAKELGDTCEKGELLVMKTGKGTVEKEGNGYDVTLPLHVSGKTIGIIGMDFKLDQQESGLVDRAKIIAREVEDQIPAKSKLFEAAK